MKTFSVTQAIFAALFLLKMGMPFTANASQRTNAVLYHNAIIPAVELKEVEISATRSATLCKAKYYHGDLIPSVEMKEVTISATGNSVIGSEGLMPIEMPGIRTRAIAWKGQLIPDVDGPEVTVTADRPAETTAEVSSEEGGEEIPVLFRVSVRQTFDRVGGFLLYQGKEMVRKFIPSEY